MCKRSSSFLQTKWDPLPQLFVKIFRHMMTKKKKTNRPKNGHHTLILMNKYLLFVPFYFQISYFASFSLLFHLVSSFVKILFSFLKMYVYPLRFIVTDKIISYTNHCLFLCFWLYVFLFSLAFSKIIHTK